MIKPGQSVGPLTLGMSKADIAGLLGDRFDEFKRTPNSRGTVLAFDDEHVHISLDEEEHVDGISVFRPRLVQLGETQLLNTEILDVGEELRAGGYVLEQVDAGLWCPAEGVLLIEVDGRVDGVELRRPG